MNWSCFSFYDKLPSQWETRRLAELVDIISGQSPDGDTVNEHGEGIPFLQGNAEFGDVHPHPKYWCTEAKKKCQVGDLLISVRAPVGELNKANQQYGLGRGLAALRAVNIHPDFLYYGMHVWRESFKRVMQGSTFDAITDRYLRQMWVAVPTDPKEQAGISQTLNAVDTAIIATRGAIKSAQDLKKALVQNLLIGKMKCDGTWRKPDEFWIHPRIGLIPNTWQVERLGKVTAKITDGEHISPDFQEEGALLLSAEDVFEDGVRLEKAKYVKLEDMLRFRRRCNPEKGDVLIVSRGASIGRTCRVQFDKPFALMGSVILIKPSDKLHAAFIAQYMKSFQAWTELRRLSGTTAQQAIYLAHTKKMFIPFPNDPVEQEEIGKRLEDVDWLIRAKEKKIRALELLKKSLLQALLTGKINIKSEEIAV